MRPKGNVYLLQATALHLGRTASSAQRCFFISSARTLWASVSLFAVFANDSATDIIVWLALF